MEETHLRNYWRTTVVGGNVPKGSIRLGQAYIASGRALPQSITSARFGPRFGLGRSTQATDVIVVGEGLLCHAN